MQLISTDIQNLNTPTKNPYETSQVSNEKVQASNNEENLEQTINKSAVSVSISMNAQSILFQMNSSDTNKNNLLSQAALSEDQNDVLNFLSGEKALNGLSLSDIGYEGKPILELSQEEATELIRDNGFFGVTQTSDRVANFVFSFAGDDLELLEKGKEGIIKGFEEAEKLFGGKLPEISYETQERTLALLDEKIATLKEVGEIDTSESETTTKE